MGIVAKAGAIIVAAVLVLYLVLFLTILPMMAITPVGMTNAMAVGIYASLYRPVRDALPAGYFIRLAWRDYEVFCCAGSTGCQL